MEKSVKKLNHLLNELALSSYSNQESAEEFLREEGYDPNKLAKSIADKVNKTIEALNEIHSTNRKG